MEVFCGYEGFVVAGIFSVFADDCFAFSLDGEGFVMVVGILLVAVKVFGDHEEFIKGCGSFYISCGHGSFCCCWGDIYVL